MDTFGQVFLTTLWIFVLFAFLMVVFRLLVDIFRSDDMGGFAKAVWIVCLIFFTPITALVYLIARGKGMSQREIDAVAKARQAQDEYIRSVSGGTDSAAQIDKAKSLLDSGAITQEEFQALKAKALAS